VTVERLAASLAHLDWQRARVGRVLYGTDMRITLAPRLRVKDVDFARPP
jgi:hypothetical protein